MIADISFASALLAGLISFISPCVLPLVPPYLCYMAGVRLENLAPAVAHNADGTMTAVEEPPAILLPAVAFVLGFTAVFVALGAGASTIGAMVRAQMDFLSVVAGIVIIIFGLHFLGLFRIGFLYREARFSGGGAGIFGSFVMGLAFAFGWTPCIGPVLGTILAVAGTRDSVGEGALLLAVYSAGLGIPFIAAALFIGPFLNFITRFRRHLDTVEKVMGGLLVLTGIMFLTGGMEWFAYWLLETFPVLGTIG
jgi:cytochrome c-type biogenesis protein